MAYRDFQRRAGQRESGVARQQRIDPSDVTASKVGEQLFIVERDECR